MSVAKKISTTETEILNQIEEKWHSQVVIVDLDEEESLKSDYSNAIGISSEMDPSVILDMAIHNKLSHVCQTNSSGFEREVNVAALMIADPEVFVNAPVASIIDPRSANRSVEENLTIFSQYFSKACEKTAMLDELENCLQGILKSNSLISDLRGVADELYTNAVFNAPFIDLSSYKNPGIDRNDLSVELGDGAKARLFVGMSDDHMIVGCQDPFGSLSLNKLLSRIRECYDRGLGDTMNMGTGGAGIGSFMVYNASVSYYVAVLKGRSTIVCCSVPFKMSSRKRSQLPKNLHFFERD